MLKITKKCSHNREKGNKLENLLDLLIKKYYIQKGLET